MEGFLGRLLVEALLVAVELLFVWMLRWLGGQSAERAVAA